jgi:hypothetical protein
LGQHSDQRQSHGNTELGGELCRVHQLAASVLNESNPDEYAEKKKRRWK